MTGHTSDKRNVSVEDSVTTYERKPTGSFSHEENDLESRHRVSRDEVVVDGGDDGDARAKDGGNY